MKFRFAPVKRPLLALTAMAGLLMALGTVPAQAVSHNNLSFMGTTGKIRVHPVFQDRTGATKLQTGDPTRPASNPNRTVGDVPSLKSNLFPSPCTPAATDCLRTAANNDAAVNASAADGHTHYHAGDKFIIVNEVAGFRAGDTILVGSPYCNFPTVGLTCKKFVPGFGLINEQPAGEVAHIVGGDVGPDDFGVGVIELASGLTRDHLEGSTITKLPTLYQGQQARVDIDHSDLLDCKPDPITSVITCNPNDVEVRAWFLHPDGLRSPSFPRRPLALNKDNPNGPYSTLVSAAWGTTTFGAGFSSFYIPREVLTTGTVGKTFSIDTADTWYTVIVEAKDVVTGATVADGVARFKLNPAAIVNLKAENPTQPGDREFWPTESVEITGGVRDNTSAAALAGFTARPAEDILVDVEVTNPGGGTSTHRTSSCIDRDPSPADSCGGDLIGSQASGHGNFMVTYGGPQGVYTKLIPSTTGPHQTTCNPEMAFIIIPCVGAVFTMLDTLDTGTYDVKASLRDFRPAVTATTSFDVVLI